MGLLTALTVLTLLQRLPTQHAAKVLLIPGEFHSCVRFFNELAMTLTSAGHEVTVLTSVKYQKIAEESGSAVLIAKAVNSSLDQHSPQFTIADVSYDRWSGLFAGLATADINLITSKMITTQILTDQQLRSTLVKHQFDLAICNGEEIFRSNLLLPYALGIRYISVTIRHDPWLVSVPALPSVDSLSFADYMDANSGFLDRVSNIFNYLMSRFFFQPYLQLDEEFSHSLVPERPAKSSVQLFRDSELIFVALDSVCLDHSHITAPHYIFLGGLTPRDPAPLPDDFQTIVNQSVNGLIVMSFGASITSLPQGKIQLVVDAFKQIPQNVIMRYKGEVLQNVPTNVFVREWLPQNDLLGQNNTQLFITHGGNNGQNEAVYHGVPMLIIPLFLDGVYNAKRDEKLGYGKTVELTGMTTEKMVGTINEVIGIPRYKRTIRKCSAILRSLPTPRDEAVRWVNHVLQWGGAHLKPYYYDMPLWKIFMLDIALVTVVVVIVIVGICVMCCTKCRMKNTKQHED